MVKATVHSSIVIPGYILPFCDSAKISAAKCINIYTVFTAFNLTYIENPDFLQ